MEKTTSTAHHRGSPITNLKLLRAVELLGGITATGYALGISYTLISKCLRHKKLFPIKQAIKIEMLTDGQVKAKDLRPDVFCFPEKSDFVLER